MSQKIVNYVRCSDPRQTPDSQMNSMNLEFPVYMDIGVQRNVKLNEREGFQECLSYLGDEGGIIKVSAFDRIGGEAAIAGAIHFGHLPENVDIQDAQGHSLRNDTMIRAVLAVLADAEKQNNSERQSRRAERQRREGRLDCPRAFGWSPETRQIIPKQMDALAISCIEFNEGTKVAEIMRIIFRETGLKLDRRRFYEWKNGKHWERIPVEYLQKWSKSSEFEKKWDSYYSELIEEYGSNLFSLSIWEQMKEICIESETQRTAFSKIYLPWLENTNFLLQKPDSDHLVNRNGETFEFGKGYKEGFN